MSRRLGVSIVAALALAAGFVPWPVPAGTFLNSLKAELPPESGIAVSARQSARFTLLPVPTITLRDAIFARENTILAQAPRVSLRMRLLPLMAGAAQVSNVILYDVSAQANANARAIWRSVLTETNAKGFRPHLTFVDGNFQLERAGDSISKVNASLEWQRARSVLNIWGHGVWRGETLRLQASGVPLTRGLELAEEQPAQIAVHTPFASAEARGSIANGRASGAWQLTMKNAAALGRWLGTSVPMAGLLDQFTLAGTGVATVRGLQLSEAALEFGPNVLKGTLSLTKQPDEKPLVSGTLATSSLELNAMANAFDAVQDKSGQWNADAFDTESLQTADLDIRISATQARVMKMSLRDAALSTTLKNGRLDLALGRSSAYGGTLRSRVTIARLSGALTEQRIQANFENVDFGKFSDDMFQMRLVSGIISGQIMAESTGVSPHAILNGLNGRGNFSITQGELTGISLTDTVRQAERAQTQLVSLQSGSTRFDSGMASVVVNNGILHVQDGRISGIGAQATLSGQINLNRKEYNMTGAVQHPLRPKQWPFEISGPWSKPAARMISQTPTQRSDPMRSEISVPDSRS